MRLSDKNRGVLEAFGQFEKKKNHKNELNVCTNRHIIEPIEYSWTTSIIYSYSDVLFDFLVVCVT